MDSSSYFETLNPKGVLRSKDFVQIVLIFFVVFLSAILLLDRISQKQKKFLKLINAIPGPRRYFLIENLPQLLPILRNPPRDSMTFLNKCYQNYGPIYKVWVLRSPKVFINCLETAMHLLQNDLIPAKSSEINKGSKIVGGEGLLAIEPHLHSERRKMWNPFFSRKRIENSMSIFRQEGVKLCRELENYCSSDDGKPIIFDFVKHSVRCTFNVICNSAFGNEIVDTVTNKNADIHIHCLHSVAVNLVSRYFQPWNIIDTIYFNLNPRGRETKKCIEIGNAIAREAVNARKAMRAEASAAPSSSKTERKMSECFLDHLLDLMEQGALSEKAVIEELNNFIAAGYDTSGAAIGFILYLLSLNPEYQERVVKELHDIIGQERLENFDPFEYEITPTDLKSMKFMEQCIKEGLRMYPVLPVILRRTIKDVELLDGRIIPAGVDVYVNVHQIQNDPKYFPEPHKFNPERNFHPKSGWMPFSLGTRNCIGQVYGMYAIKVILAQLLLTYKFETVEKEGFKPIYQVVFVPENGMRFKLTKRNISSAMPT